MKKNNFFKGRINAFGFAFKGIKNLLKSEANFQVEFSVALVMIILGFVFQITVTEWLFQIFAIGFVFSLEAINSAVEALSDALHPEWNEKIGKVKDLAAGAVLLASITAVVIGLIIYAPYILDEFLM